MFSLLIKINEFGIKLNHLNTWCISMCVHICVYSISQYVLSCANGWFWWGDNFVSLTVLLFVFWIHKHQSFSGVHPLPPPPPSRACWYYLDVQSVLLMQLKSWACSEMEFPFSIQNSFRAPTLMKGVSLQWWSNVHYWTNKHDCLLHVGRALKMHALAHTHTHWSDHPTAVSLLSTHLSKALRLNYQSSTHETTIFKTLHIAYLFSAIVYFTETYMFMSRNALVESSGPEEFLAWIKYKLGDQRERENVRGETAMVGYSYL